MLGRWCIECKAYGSGAEPRPDWWEQVLSSSKAENLNQLLSINLIIDQLKLEFLQILLTKI